MAEIDDLQTYAVNILQDVIARADAAEDGAMRAEAFAELMFEHLADAGEIDDGISCPFEGRGLRCSGYFLSEDNDRLDLFLVVPRLDGTAATVPKADIDTGFKRLKSTCCCSGFRSRAARSASSRWHKHCWPASLQSATTLPSVIACGTSRP